MRFQKLHEEATRLSKNYFRAEAELLDVLQKIDAVKAFRDFQCTSLYQYAVSVLKLSEATAYNFINVARKAVQIPELKAEIDKGNLSIGKARKIVPVLDNSDTQENQREWIEKVKTLSSRKLEQEVAKVAPKEETPESSKFVTESRRALKLGMDESDFQNLKRVQDLESQRQKQAVSMEDAIGVMVKLYLEMKDPLLKAERAVDRVKPVIADSRNSEPVPGQAGVKIPPRFFLMSRFESHAPIAQRIPIPALDLHRVRLRDQMRCTHLNAQNERCDQERWLEIHHVKSVSQGGNNQPSNLTTLCSEHHRQRHDSGVRNGSTPLKKFLS